MCQNQSAPNFDTTVLYHADFCEPVSPLLVFNLHLRRFCGLTQSYNERIKAASIVFSLLYITIYSNV